MDAKREVENRVAFIRSILTDSKAKGIVFGNSGGKDSALVGILCKMACPDTVAVIMPCFSQRNYTIDKQDGMELSSKFDIETRVVDLTPVRAQMLTQLEGVATLNEAAVVNIAPRLRMATLYSIAAAEGRLVAGTGNRSERFVGYFTKWGDGACDFNPIADLTVGQIYELLEYLGCPRAIIEKAPSASLYDGQTDEKELGITYRQLDEYITVKRAKGERNEKLEKMFDASAHKRKPPVLYKTMDEE
ncbi:MAG: NAD(+) synthase [Christensenellales bacterium]